MAGEKSLNATTQECRETILNKSWRQHPTKATAVTATYHPSQKLSKLDEPDMQDTAGEVGTRS